MTAIDDRWADLRERLAAAKKATDKQEAGTKPRIPEYSALLSTAAALLAERDALAAENEQLRTAVAFARSVIKSGEPWTPTCDERLRVDR